MNRFDFTRQEIAFILIVSTFFGAAAYIVARLIGGPL